MTEYAQKTIDLLLTNGFRLTEQKASEYFGDYCIEFTNSQFKIRLLSDRSFESIDICWYHDDSQWYDIARVQAMINNQNEVTRAISLQESYNFLVSHLNSLDDIYSEATISLTRKKLDRLGRKRAHKLIGHS